MSQNLWPPLPGPDLLVDPHSTRTEDPASQSNVGWQNAPLGRQRLVWAMATSPDGPAYLEQPTLVTDTDGIALGDPDGNALGMPGVTIHRLLTAGWVQMTR